ncbi:hypothetical protein [Pinibacter soli]|uniref:Uncharacterized protein n=1 Tax=Pinibacter soli TaxID=3044211 RepID=A0ABT6R9I9_9BACT|nr:hypothetical protein [Pinibacter soli]MDI3319168.1 hypothetical protein [Pinibacter soli]
MQKAYRFTLITFAVVLMSMTAYRKLASILVSQNDIDEAVKNYLLNDVFATNYDSWYKIRPQGLKLPSGDRAALMSDLLKRAKDLVNSKEFKESYEISIETNKEAYDYKHKDTLQSKTGLAYNNAIAAQKQVSEYQMPDAEATRKAMIQTMNSLPPSVLVQAVGQQIVEIKEQMQDNEKNEAEKKQLQKSLKEKQDLLALSKTNPNEFKKKAIESLYPADMNEKMNNAKNEQDQQFQEQLKKLKEDMAQEQRNYDTYKLENVLPEKLKAFIEEAKSVDYDATVIKGRFTNPVYERKNNNWKYFYRMGREPMQQAISFAEKWLSELKK